MIAAAAGLDGTARRALGELFALYRPPVLAYLRRHAESDADDLAQGFFEQLMRLNSHASADPAKGSFRNFLMVALKRFVMNQREAANALKRGGGCANLDIESTELTTDHTPEREFDREFAKVVVRQALKHLESEASRAGKLALFQTLSPFLFDAGDPQDYARAAEALGMRRNTVAVAVHRLRQRLQELVRQEVLGLVEDERDVESEVRALRIA